MLNDISQTEKKETLYRDFPGCPIVGTSTVGGSGSTPWSGN